MDSLDELDQLLFQDPSKSLDDLSEEIGLLNNDNSFDSENFFIGVNVDEFINKLGLSVPVSDVKTEYDFDITKLNEPEQQNLADLAPGEPLTSTHNYIDPEEDVSNYLPNFSSYGTNPVLGYSPVCLQINEGPSFSHCSVPVSSCYESSVKANEFQVFPKTNVACTQDAGYAVQLQIPSFVVSVQDCSSSGQDDSFSSGNCNIVVEQLQENSVLVSSKRRNIRKNGAAGEPTPRRRNRERKEKVYEKKPLEDPELEKKRLNAINAKKNRDEKNKKMNELKDHVKRVEQERDALQIEVTQLRHTEQALLRALQEMAVQTGVPAPMVITYTHQQ